MKKPLHLALISPRSLEAYASLLGAGFTAMQRVMPASFGEFQSFIPYPAEDHTAFRTRLEKVIHRFHAVIIQLHGSHDESPLAFDDFGLVLTRRILLIHRPQELLERQRQGFFYPKALDCLLRRFDCTVLLGRAMLAPYEQRAPRVAVIPHGFSQIKPVRLRTFGIACVGAIASFGDMRWLADGLSLHQAYLEQRRQEKIIFYMAGSFAAFHIPGREGVVDELKELKLQVAHDPDCRVRLLPSSELERGFAAGEFDDLNSWREWLYRYSDDGRKMLVVTGTLQTAPLRRLQDELLDFNLQLCRELLCDFQPKVAYSGSLHKAPGSQIPIVWDSPSMADVHAEGLTHMIKIKPPLTHDPHSASRQATESWSSANFSEAMLQVLSYMSNPNLFNEHRAEMFGQASPLSFTAVARRYLSLIASMEHHQPKAFPVQLAGPPQAYQEGAAHSD